MPRACRLSRIVAEMGGARSGCTGVAVWSTGSPADWRLLLLVFPRVVSCYDALPPVLSVLPGGVRAHSIHLVAFVARFDLLVLEAVVPLALCGAEVH